MGGQPWTREQRRNGPDSWAQTGNKAVTGVWHGQDSPRYTETTYAGGLPPVTTKRRTGRKLRFGMDLTALGEDGMVSVVSDYIPTATRSVCMPT